MLNIPELERRWFQYKLKSYIPHLSIVISLIIIFILSSFFYSYNRTTLVPQMKKKVLHSIKEQAVKQDIKNVIKEKVVQPTIVTSTSKHVQHIVDTDNKQKLTPSLDFMKRMQNSVQPYYQHEEAQIVTPRQEDKPTPNAPVENIIKTVTQVSPPQITIRREDTKNDIRDIIKRFKNNNNPALSLFVAKKSYELGDYKQAYNYALITNRINSDIESSWIVFAKSLVKLGEKEKAIQTLKKYIKYSNSVNAKILLNHITSGKFR